MPILPAGLDEPMVGPSILTCNKSIRYEMTTRTHASYIAYLIHVTRFDLLVAGYSVLSRDDV
jgi:hypothetical protein